MPAVSKVAKMLSQVKRFPLSAGCQVPASAHRDGKLTQSLEIKQNLNGTCLNHLRAIPKGFKQY